MAAPSATARVVPPGQPMKEGWRCLITFLADPDVLLWEVGATPPGIDGGDPIDTTNQFTGTWLVMRPRTHRTLTPASMQVNYAALVYPQIEALVNLETTVTYHFPSGNYVAFYGYLRSFTPGQNSIGEDPEATAVVQPTNWDPVNNVVAGPTTGTASAL